jgi:glutamate N-acetyltransferase / amino-acid N-acetyltransferase
MSKFGRSPEKVLVPQGFRFAAVTAGIKLSGRPDLALAEVAGGASATALFTSNRVMAAPVVVGRRALAASRGRVCAVIVNSGNANCATGKAGIDGCKSVCRDLAKILGVPTATIFPSSTGIIGVKFPAQKVRAALRKLLDSRSSSSPAATAFAQAIMTTDTRPKIASARFRTARSVGEVTVLGIAKGAGMIHPQLATMLVYVFTDALASAKELRTLLRSTCDETLNCISIDGDTSTNDTALLVASGASGVGVGEGRARRKFVLALASVCQSLAEQIVSDGEGVQHVIRLQVGGARNRDQAMTVARAISHSLLVKTAWAGADPNWGRILAAVGRSGIDVDPARVQIYVGNQRVCRGGVADVFDRRRAHRDLAAKVCVVRVELGQGKRSAHFLTTDLTADYVRINADYST